MKCCLIGLHAKYLPWKYEQAGFRFWLLKKRLKNYIEKMIKCGYYYFITGMSLGIDILAAELILKLRNKYKHIILECALPCIDQSARWSESFILKYQNILFLADKVTYVSDCLYFNGCIAKRNKYMIEKSNLLISVFDGIDDEIAQTINMAKNYNLEIKVLRP